MSNLFSMFNICLGHLTSLIFVFVPLLLGKPSLDDYCIEVRLNEQVVEMIPGDKKAARPLRLSYVLKYFHDCLPENYDMKALCGLKPVKELDIPE